MKQFCKNKKTNLRKVKETTKAKFPLLREAEHPGLVKKNIFTTKIIQKKSFDVYIDKIIQKIQYLYLTKQ